MSNNLKRAAGTPTTNGPSKGPTTTAGNTKSFIDDMIKIKELIERLSKDNTGRQGYEQLQQELQRKSKEVEDTKQQAEAAREESERKIEELQTNLDEQTRFNKTLQITYTGQVVAWSEDKRRLEDESAEISSAKEELERVQDELDAIKGERDKLSHDHSRLSKSLEDGQKRLIEVVRRSSMQRLDLKKKELELKEKDDELQISRSTLKELNDDLGLLPPLDMDKMEDSFRDLASKFHKLVWNTFSNDRGAPANALLINVSGTVLPRIPQVASNSQAARYMRCALVEATIAEVLSTDVFQDTYLGGIPGSEDLAPLVTAMRRLQDGRHGMQATIIRCQLVKICQESGSTRNIASQASQRVSQTFRPWLGDDKWEGFSRELDGLFFKAVKLWQKIQRTRTHTQVVMSFEESLWDYRIDSHREYDETERPAQDPRSSMTLEFPGTGPVAILFPQIQATSDPSEQEGDNFIFHGHALFPTQPAFAAAWAERSTQPTTPTWRRSSTIDRRRGSRTERQEGQAEAQRPASRRPSTSSRDGVQQRSVMAIASDSGGSVLSSVVGKADPAASVSSTRSRRSGSAARGGG